MTKKFNPFRPNQPVYSGMFVGRMDEIKRIDKILFQTKNGNPTNILIIGEKGIGKSSLLLVTKYFASGEISFEQDKYNFLTITIGMDEKTTLIDLARKIKLGLERELKVNQKLLSTIQGAWSFFQRIETNIVKVRDANQTETPDEFIDNLIFSLVDSVKTLTSKDENIIDLHCRKDGLVILIDEADKSLDDLSLGSFLKLLSERLVSEGCNQVLIVLAGLPRLRDVLYKSHSSSLRLFEELELSPLSPEEVKTVISRGLKESYDKSQVETKIEPEALDLIVGFSEGYPHFVQQIGYSAFDTDTDNNITVNDAQIAMFMPSGAIDLIGNRYYKNLYYSQIREEAYRKILQIMASKWNEWITKSEIKQQFQGTASTLDNGITTLIKRNIILKKEGARGIYRLQWASFAFWIKNFTRMEQQAAADKKQNGQSQ
ncbi:MAG: AAA family ATPase [Candidatus Omnitrophota bacterium]